MTSVLQTQLSQAFNAYSIPAAFGASDLLFGWKQHNMSNTPLDIISSDEDEGYAAANDQEKNKLSMSDRFKTEYRHHF